MTVKQLANLIEEGQSLKLISETYTEIASSKLKHIRRLVEKNRFFLNDLSTVYAIVKKTATKKNILPEKNNRTVCILITSNYHFYGEINDKLIAFFQNVMEKKSTDKIIIGKTALEWLQTNKYDKSYDSLVFTKDYPNAEELNALVFKIKDYSQVLVFYTELQSVMVQIPTYKDITQTAFLDLEKTQNEKGEKIPQIYIFEPEIEKIAIFFENQVNNLLLQQTFLESDLSRTASRLLAMDKAQSNADSYIFENLKLLDLVKRNIVNNRLIETYAALISLKIWKTK